MTSKRNLGPVIALAGAGIAVAAVIAGFILVGGPGDARERRLDDMTMQRITSIIQAAQCELNTTGVTPASIEAMNAFATRAAASGKMDACAYNAPQIAQNARIRTGSRPQTAGDVTFEKLGDRRISLCGNFRRPFDPAQIPGLWDGRAYPELMQARTAPGEHCYEITLVTMETTPTPADPVLLPPSPR